MIRRLCQFLPCPDESVCVCVCLAIEVTWEDQQRGLNGSVSDGGTQPQPSLTDAGWLVGLLVDFCLYMSAT